MLRAKGNRHAVRALFRPTDRHHGYSEIGQVHAFEGQNIQRALQVAKWKIAGSGGAAELLGVRPTTLNSNMKAFGIDRPSGHAGS